MFNKQTSIQTARSAAAQGMVLLKNEDNLLPLKKGSRMSTTVAAGALPMYSVIM